MIAGGFDSGGWGGPTRLEAAAKRQAVYNIICCIPQLSVSSLAVEAEKECIDLSELRNILKDLRRRGLIFSPKRGYVSSTDWAD